VSVRFSKFQLGIPFIVCLLRFRESELFTTQQKVAFSSLRTVSMLELAGIIIQGIICAMDGMV
jgi:hypothetical protein